MASNKFFISTYGRSGSTLLSQILLRSGAAFNHKVSLNQKHNNMESKKIDYAIKYLNAANKINRTEDFSRINNLKFDFLRSISKKIIKSELKKCDFIKNRGISVLLPLVPKLKIKPKIIVSYRKFSEILQSDIKEQKNVPYYYLNDLYKEYFNALYLLNNYGGLIIDYKHIIDIDNKKWATKLSQLTNLSEERLISSRNELIKNNSKKSEMEMPLTNDLKDLEEKIKKQVNQLFLGTKL